MARSPGAGRTRPLLVGLLLVAPLAASPAATAPSRAGPAPLRVDCQAAAGRLLAVLDLSPAIDTDLERRLGRGLTGTVRLTVAAVDASGAVAASAERDVDVRFDVWTETYTVTVRERGASAVSRQGDWATVRQLLATPAPFDLGPLLASPEPFTIEARLELDPVTSLQLERTRELLTHPAGGPGAGARSLLGTLAAVLLRPPPSEARLFRSTARSRAELIAP